MGLVPSYCDHRQKGTDKKRLTVDFKKLNDQVRQPAHPTHSLRDPSIANIAGAKYFKLDACHRHWQVPMLNNAKALTTFITPWGRFRFLRNPQGLISADNKINHRTDAAFQGLPKFANIVDDYQGWTNDADKIAAIRDFPMPNNQTDLCLLLSLVSQFGEFTACMPGRFVSTTPWSAKDVNGIRLGL